MCASEGQSGLYQGLDAWHIRYHTYHLKYLYGTGTREWARHVTRRFVSAWALLDRRRACTVRRGSGIWLRPASRWNLPTKSSKLRPTESTSFLKASEAGRRAGFLDLARWHVLCQWPCRRRPPAVPWPESLAEPHVHPPGGDLHDRAGDLHRVRSPVRHFHHGCRPGHHGPPRAAAPHAADLAGSGRLGNRGQRRRGPADLGGRHTRVATYQHDGGGSDLLHRGAGWPAAVVAGRPRHDPQAAEAAVHPLRRIAAWPGAGPAHPRAPRAHRLERVPVAARGEHPVRRAGCSPS